MSALAVVVEALSDVAILRKLLPERLAESVRYFAGQGKMSLASLARNILVNEEGPVVVIQDADAFNPKAAEESRQLTLATLRSIAPHAPADVFAFVPEIEVVFVESPVGLRTLTDGRSGMLDAHLAPKAALTELLKQNGRKSVSSWVDDLSSQDWEQIRTGAQAAKFVAVVEAMHDASIANAVG